MFNARQQRSGTFADIVREKSDMARDSLTRSSAERKARDRAALSDQESRRKKPVVEKKKSDEPLGLVESIARSLDGFAETSGVGTQHLPPLDIAESVLGALAEDAEVMAALRVIEAKISEADAACAARRVQLGRTLRALRLEHISFTDADVGKMFDLAYGQLR